MKGDFGMICLLRAKGITLFLINHHLRPMKESVDRFIALDGEESSRRLTGYPPPTP